MSVILNLRQWQSILRIASCVELAGCRVKCFKHTQSPAEQDIARENANFKYEDQPLLSRLFMPDEGKMPFSVELKKRFTRKHGMTDYYASKQRKVEEDAQKVDKEQLEALGPDLAVASFVLPYGAGVKFANKDKWLYAKGTDGIDLPGLYDANYVLTGADISGIPLRYISLQFFENLPSLTHFSIARCEHVTDWWLDFISGAIPSLKHIDISGCTNITFRGISVLYRLDKLESLTLRDIPYDPMLEIALLELELVLPKLRVYGNENWENVREEQKEESSHPEKSEESNQDVVRAKSIKV